MRWSGMQSWLVVSRPVVVDASIEIVSPQRGPARTTSFGFMAIDAFKQNDCRAAAVYPNRLRRSIRSESGCVPLGLPTLLTLRPARMITGKNANKSAFASCTADPAPDGTRGERPL